MLSIALALLGPEPDQGGPPTPCIEVSRPIDRPTEWRNFANLLTIGIIHIRSLEGQSNCSFDRSPNVTGRCTLSDAQLIVVNTGQADVWYQVPAGQPVHIAISDATYTCMVGRTVRTD